MVLASNLEGKIIESANYKYYAKLNFSGTTEVFTRNFKEDEKIPYTINYHEHINTHFKQSKGDTSLTFIDEDTFKRQRGILTHVISKIGTNILAGKGIMNISLPIKLFDSRSVLEIFAFESKYAPHFLEKAGEEENEIERLKLVIFNLYKGNCFRHC